MKRVFISTNWDRLSANVLPIAAPDWGQDNKGIYLLGPETPILYYNHNSKTFQSEKVESNIILLYDENYSETISNIPINKEKDCLLHHSKPDKPTPPSYSEKFMHLTTGEHELTGKKYPDVFKIIFDKEENKFERILSVLGFTPEQINEKHKLEAALNFLHECLTGTEVVLPAEFENCRTQYTNWSANKSIENLRLLRDAVLVESGL